MNRDAPSPTVVWPYRPRNTRLAAELPAESSPGNDGFDDVAARLARRWIITFLFGLVHGFGFSFGLEHTLQFAGTHLLTSLLSFNVGVELGQLLVLAVLVPALDLLFRFVVAERMGITIVSALVAHTAWHWMTERFDVLRQYPWPTATAAGLATSIRWLMLLVAVAAAAWLASIVARRVQQPRSGASPARAGD